MPHLRSRIGITAHIERRARSVPAHARIGHAVRVFTRPRLTPGRGEVVSVPVRARDEHTVRVFARPRLTPGGKYLS